MPIFIWNIPLKWTGVKVTQSCLTLWDPMDYRVHGILQARILEWVSFPFSRGSSQPRDQTQVSHIAGRFFTIWATREAHIPLVSLIFLKKSLVFNFCCFPPFLCIDRWERLSYLSLLFFGTLHSDGYIFPFLLYLLLLLFSQLFVKPSQMTILPFCISFFFFLRMVLITASCTISQICIHSSSGTLSDLIPWIHLLLPLYNKGFDLGYTLGTCGFPSFLQLKPEFCNNEFMIWATFSSRSCFADCIELLHHWLQRI